MDSDIYVPLVACPVQYGYHIHHCPTPFKATIGPGLDLVKLRTSPFYVNMGTGILEEIT